MTKRKPIAGGRLKAPDKRRKRVRSQTFILTTAQNNTFVHDKFWKSLMHLVEERNATLLIAKTRYNKAAYRKAGGQPAAGIGDDDAELWWDKRLEPYFSTTSTQLARDLVWCASTDTAGTRRASSRT